eukprot:Skav208207  [mRNA]  locus=scaffold2026:296404:302046:+ [translate_table: standard]
MTCSTVPQPVASPAALEPQLGATEVHFEGSSWRGPVPAPTLIARYDGELEEVEVDSTTGATTTAAGITAAKAKSITPGGKAVPGASTSKAAAGGSTSAGSKGATTGTTTKAPAKKAPAPAPAPPSQGWIVGEPGVIGAHILLGG